MAACHSGYLTCSGVCACAAVQLREDVTRFRYGDEQHLDDTLTRLFQFNRPKGVPRRRAPHFPSKSGCFAVHSWLTCTLPVSML